MLHLHYTFYIIDGVTCNLFEAWESVQNLCTCDASVGVCGGGVLKIMWVGHTYM